MLFKMCKFREKNHVRKTMKECILSNVKQEVTYDKCNDGRILEYIDLLLDESHYHIKTGTFYYKYRWVKVDLNCELFSKIAIDYILEHSDDFLLEKYKTTK